MKTGQWKKNAKLNNNKNCKAIHNIQINRVIQLTNWFEN